MYARFSLDLKTCNIYLLHLPFTSITRCVIYQAITADIALFCFSFNTLYAIGYLLFENLLTRYYLKTFINMYSRISIICLFYFSRSCHGAIHDFNWPVTPFLIIISFHYFAPGEIYFVTFFFFIFFLFIPFNLSSLSLSKRKNRKEIRVLGNSKVRSMLLIIE